MYLIKDDKSPEVPKNLGELILAVSDHSKSSQETLEKMARLLNTGRVRVKKDGLMQRAKVVF